MYWISGKVQAARQVRSRGSEQLQEFRRGGLGVAGADEIGDFAPIYRGEIEPVADPAADSDVGREVKPAGIGLCEAVVVTLKRLAADADDLCFAGFGGIVFVEEVSKDFFRDEERGVGWLVFAGCAGEGEANLRELGHATLDRCLRCHFAVAPAMIDFGDQACADSS